MEYLSPEQKKMLEENNDAIDRAEKTEERLQEIREGVSEIRRTVRPSIYSMVERTVETITGRTPEDFVAREGIGKMNKRSDLSTALKNFTMNIFNRRK